MNYEFKKEGIVLSCFKENLHFFYIYIRFDFVIKNESMHFISKW